jgi:translation elongation factor EF-4
VKLEEAIQKKQNQNGYLLNLITDPDCPVQPQAAALSLRITDGAIIVLDAGLGIWYVILCNVPIFY